MRKAIRLGLGCMLWIGMALWAGRLLTDKREADAGTLASIARHLTTPDVRYRIALPAPVVLKVGTVVEVHGKPSGEVDALLVGSGGAAPRISADIVGETQLVQIRLTASAQAWLHAGSTARLLEVPQAAAWVVKTLFTAETIPQIASEWNQTMLAHREKIFGLLTPIARDLILDFEKHVESELPAFIQRHQSELSTLGDELKRSFGGERLAGLFEAEIWPIARPKLSPIVEKISDEIWEKLPLWTLTWRLAYQSLPLTDNDHLQRALAGFLDAQALPILRAHLDEMLAVTREIAREALAREEVHTTLREAFGSIVAHSNLHELVQAFLREVMLDNARFHEVLWARARSPEAQRALEAAAVHVEPMVRRMGDIVLGTREAGITREFARVLRSQILLKDRYRVIIDPGPESAPLLPEGSTLPAAVEVEHGK